MFREAAVPGVLQVHISGGEPGSRRDIVDIVAAAHAAPLYTNLITSGVGPSKETLAALADAGLDHVQISIQDGQAVSADHIAGYKGAYARKNELGLDHNETRSWHGWRRHVSLVMLAFAMMAVIRHQANVTAPKKTLPRLRTKHS